MDLCLLQRGGLNQQRMRDREWQDVVMVMIRTP
ncbi:hypothetical protein C5167_028019, partial [Papaver somniferum]